MKPNEIALFTEKQANDILSHWKKLKEQGDKRMESERKKGIEESKIPLSHVYISGIIADESIIEELEF